MSPPTPLAPLMLIRFLGVLLAGCAAAPHPSVSPRPQVEMPVQVALSVRAARSKLPGGREVELAVAVDIGAAVAPLLRAPLDVALVFDTSASMREDRKLSYTLAAAKLLIQNLTPHDTLSIVTFGTDVSVLERQQPATRKLFLSHWFDELEPGGFTNLSGGLLAGLAELRRERRPDAQARVILLTDGRANRGSTDPRSLVWIATRAAGEGISISTIGVGADFDADLLSALAGASGGRYQHVARGEDLPSAIAREVEGPPLAAQNVELDLVPAEGVALVDPGASDVPARVTRSRVDELGSMSLGDLAAGERRSVYAIVHVKAGAPGLARPVLVARLRYQDPAGETVTRERPLSLDVASDGKGTDELVDEPLLGEIRLVRLLDLAYRALLSRDLELASVARRRIADGASDLEALARYGETQVLKEQAALVAHLGEELAKLETGDLLHEHEEVQAGRAGAESEALVNRYLLLHHRREDAPEHEEER